MTVDLVGVWRGTSYTNGVLIQPDLFDLTGNYISDQGIKDPASRTTPPWISYGRVTTRLSLFAMITWSVPSMAGGRIRYS